VIICPAGNAQIAGIPLKPMRIPMSARHARKNANFWIIPATRRIAPPMALMIESAAKRDRLFEMKGYYFNLPASRIICV
jgi:hypothetical protein